MAENNIFDFDSMKKIISYIERGVTDVSSFLSFKLQEIDEAQKTSFESGQRGVQIIISDWMNAPMRDATGKWPLDEASFYIKNAPYSDAVWHQEYRWDWNASKHQVRKYWAPENFEFPTSIKVPDEEPIEEIIGVLGVNTCYLPFFHLPPVPPVRGYRPRNASLALIYIQKYKLEWEEPTLFFQGWDMRWNLDLRTVWFQC